MDLIAAGTVTTGNQATLSPGVRTGKWFVMNMSAVQTTVKFGSRGPTITLPSTNASFIEVEGDYQSITVNGASVSYYVMG